LCFSSRRRHTRFSRDWSSDVCSSDLARRGGKGPVGDDRPGGGDDRPGWWVTTVGRHRLPGKSVTTNGRHPPYDQRSSPTIQLIRSEERRVGKECRHEWLWYLDQNRRL